MLDELSTCNIGTQSMPSSFSEHATGERGEDRLNGLFARFGHQAGLGLPRDDDVVELLLAGVLWPDLHANWPHCMMMIG
jgi:hypothetical protein